ncbi:MATH and LRR domain-containing protein PFE0570w-like [Galleria mellonella]|uniref:MATH and LRR domain-containing protein PFE0570w-like n=1 Tax=Galleria mellonella TaxID=7137 RepID=A0A6J1WGJ3_GALME|nr:MATH and LRR domain-containing protein PFE0570w-like [Galleria mellonella]
MEVGAVKQAFNNEVILLKKKLNQARIQIIHKLTRKAKTFTEKKAPEKQKEKLKRKAESAVKEVLILKKIKPKDLAKFIITHTGNLNDYLNKPNVDQDKACARLLLHKSLQDKYKFIRGRFAGIPIADLFMSRQERKKLKKEAKDKNKKKKGIENEKIVNSEGNWEVEDVEMDNDSKELDENATSDEMGLSDEDESNEEVASDNQSSLSNEENLTLNNDLENEVFDAQKNVKKQIKTRGGKTGKESNEDSDKDNDELPASIGKFVRFIPDKVKSDNDIDDLSCNNSKSNIEKANKTALKNSKNTEKKGKDSNKNKNFNEKILLRKFKRDEDEIPTAGKKVVDPFFITATGENYMSVAEPRQPDEIKEIHKQGNRKLRRAAMFGHVPKIKPGQNHFRNNNSYSNGDKFDSKLNYRNKFNNQSDNYENKVSKNAYNKSDSNDSKKTRFDKFSDRKSEQNEDKQEKLHPSWEAKKRQSGILPFQGKKIVFDDG